MGYLNEDLEEAWDQYRQTVGWVKAVAELDEHRAAFEAGWRLCRLVMLRDVTTGPLLGALTGWLQEARGSGCEPGAPQPAHRTVALSAHKGTFYARAMVGRECLCIGGDKEGGLAGALSWCLYRLGMQPCPHPETLPPQASDTQPGALAPKHAEEDPHEQP